MSRILKRPMFRKGGTTGGGIMNNIVERGQYAESNADDLNLSIKEKLKIVDDMAGTSKLDDPITSFLLQLGPQIVKQTGGGGLIPNLLLASEKPVQSLLKDRRSERATKRAIALDFVKDLSDSDKIALQEQIEYLMSEEGGGFTREEAFDRLKPAFRKSKSPVDVERDERALKLEDIVKVTSDRMGPTLTTDQANLIYLDEQKLSKINPEAYNNFLRTSSRDKYVYGVEEYKGDTSLGANVNPNGTLASLPENTYVYDITTGDFIYRQGNKVFKIDLDVEKGE